MSDKEESLNTCGMSFDRVGHDYDRLVKAALVVYHRDLNREIEGVHDQRIKEKKEADERATRLGKNYESLIEAYQEEEKRLNQRIAALELKGKNQRVLIKQLRKKVRA